MVKEYLEIIRTAILAGEKVKEVYDHQTLVIEIKEDHSPVTQADKISSQTITRVLESTKIPVIDEEQCLADYSVRKDWNKFWLVDPLDGTKEFISRNGEFTINIAYIENARPEFGVIYAPVPDLLYFGGIRTGSFKLEKASRYLNGDLIIEHAELLAPAQKQTGRIKVIASRSHLDAHTIAFIEQLKKEYGDIELVSKGSSLKMCMIAEGEAHIYPRFSRTMEWDTAAGHAIIKGTEGVVLQAGNDSMELEYNKPNLANPGFVAYSNNFSKQK